MELLDAGGQGVNGDPLPNHTNELNAHSNQHSGMVKCWHGHTDFPIVLCKNHTK